MKKFFYSLFAVATMLLATTSCSQDELENVAQGNEVDVTFTLKQEGATTRAIGDGTTAKYLYFGAYLDDNYVETLQPEGYTKDTHVQFDADLTATVKLRLVKGQTYKFLFWAQSTTDETYYTVDFENKQVKVDYSKAANDEKRDAFWTTKEFLVTGPLTETITLKRPFAQINVGIEKGELAEATAAGVDLTQSSFVVKNVANVLNVFEGTVSVSTDPALEEGKTLQASFTAAETPAKWDGQKYNGEYLLNVDGVDYEYIAMNYVLVNTTQPANDVAGAGKDNTDVTFTIYDGDKEIKTYTVPFLPVQRNWRTNIIASIMTDAEFKIVIDPNFIEDHNYPKTDKEKLEFAAANGGEVTLTENVELAEQLVVAAGSHLVLDLGGKNLTVNPAKSEIAIKIEEGAKLTIKGEGKVATERTLLYAVYGELDVQGGEHTAALEVVEANGQKAVAVISGGTFTGGEYKGNYWTLNLKDNTGATIIVKGGKFYMFNPADNVCEGKGTNFVAEGYVSIASEENGKTVYTVTWAEELLTKNAANEWVISTAKQLATFSKKVTEEGVSFVGETVILANDIDLEGLAWSPIGGSDSYTNNFAGTFDGKGFSIKNLTVNNKKCAGLFGTLTNATIKNVTVENANLTTNHFAGAVVAWAEQGGKPVVIENCHVKGGVITVTPEWDAENNCYDNGDKAGGVVGWMYFGTLSNSSASDVTITAYRDLGGVIGYIKGTTLSGNSANDVTLVVDQSATPYGDGTPEDTNAGKIVGRVDLVNNQPNTSVPADNAIDATVNSATALADVLANGGNATLAADVTAAATVKLNGTTLDGAGNTFTMALGESEESLALGIQANGGTIKNLVVKGNNERNKAGKGYRAIYISKATENVVIENVTIDGVAYPINTGATAEVEGLTLTVKNSTLIGWTSFSAGFASAGFDGCKFGVGTYYQSEENPSWDGCVKPYVATTFKNCAFEEGFVVDAVHTDNGVDYAPAISFENCTYDGAPLTKNNIALLLAEDAETAKVTVK